MHTEKKAVLEALIDLYSKVWQYLVLQSSKC